MPDNRERQRRRGRERHERPRAVRAARKLSCSSAALPASYTSFGTITSGLDILQNVAKAGTSCTYSAGGGVPKEKVVIENVDIRKI